jgi:L-alanine-DL-glutamate epimerase-like enolase superfamily enzyme
MKKSVPSTRQSRPIDRRDFLRASAVAAAAAFTPRWLWAADLPQDIRITRVVAFDLPLRRIKYIGKNSRLDDHGDTTTNRLVRLYTNGGFEGLGYWAGEKDAFAAILGKNLYDYFTPGQTAITGPLSRATMSVWDLAGHVLQQPVYRLLGANGPEHVPVYDGSIYFSDLLPAHAGRWADRFREEIDDGLRRGYRSFKIKIGRGAKWMPAEEGYARDKAVITLIRRHVGPGIQLEVDSNNGYDLERTKRLLTELPDAQLAFVEEMFPEDIAQDLALKAFIAENRLETLVADGESQQSPETFRPFIEARAIDICQGDMNYFGLEGVLGEAAIAGPCGARVAPHNWGSLIGFYLMLHIGRAITNFYSAENDPLQSDVLIADGYAITNGLATVSDAPGFGLKLDEAKFAALRPTLDLRA